MNQQCKQAAIELTHHIQVALAYSELKMYTTSIATCKLNSSSYTCNNNCSCILNRYVYNLTSSYTDQSNELAMVGTSGVMCMFAALFFTINLYSRSSDLNANVIPAMKIVLSTSLSLFLPVMSYLFSEAKNNGQDAGSAPGDQNQMAAELPLRARTILMWMLLVELLRKKVEAILLDTKGSLQVYNVTMEHASRIGWLAYLVFFNIRSAGKRAFYAIFWVFAAAKLVQRYVSWEVGRRSFAYGRNPQLLASYMTQMLREEQRATTTSTSSSGPELLMECNYIVMGEENMEKKAGPNGYSLGPTTEITKDDSAIVTVRKVWKVAESAESKGTSRRMRERDIPRLKWLCLSFALYKLLRRRLEDFPITDAEARNCHDLIFKGLCQEEEEGTDKEATAAARLFQVLNDEVQFLCEYYHSIHPVMLASPFYFLVIYILVPIVVCASCILTIILCSNGDVLYAFDSFTTDNYAATDGLVKVAVCILKKIRESPMALFSVIDISVTILLLLAIAYEEIWQFIVFLLSNWFMVSLVCGYTSDPRWRESPLLLHVISRILWVRSNLSQPNVCFKQFSVLWLLRLPSTPTLVAVPDEAKKSIMQRLRLFKAGDVVPRSNGMHALHLEQHRWSLQSDEPLRACDSEGLAEVILTWHIATALLEAKHPLPKKTKPGPSRKVATALSGYCAHLVAFHPELLPDDKDGTERAYKDMKEEMKKEMRCWGYHLFRQRKLMEIAERGPPEVTTTTVLSKGAMLGKVLMDRYKEAATDEAPRGEHVWKLLADLWTEVLVSAAPTGSELHVKAHKEALADGGEFITLLWALATHTGIARGGPVVATPPASTEAMATEIV